MKRRLFCVLLSLCLIFSCVTPSLAANIGSKAAFENEIVEKTFSVLQFMEPEKELYGLGNIDFSALYLGEQLPAYIVEPTGMIAETDILYYPIMSESAWVATAIITTDSAGKVNSQVSTEYATAYNHAGASGDVALIFDSSAAYISTEEEILLAAKAPNEISNRGNLSSFSGLNNINREKLSAKRAIVSKNVSSPRSFDNQYYLAVPCVQQAANSLQCWAACIAAIRGYYDTETTIDQVYTKAGVPKYNGVNIYKAAATLEDYNYTLDWYWDGGYNWYQLRTAIYFYERPIYTACTYAATSGHAVVIRGFYVYQNISQVGIITYMDPAVGRYVSSSVATDGDFYYVPSGSSAQYTMSTFLEVIE